MSTEIECGSLGDSFEDFLKEQGTYEETTEHAIKSSSRVSLNRR